MYNHAGTDLDDPYIAHYEFHHKSSTWQRRIFSHFTFVAARNSHILYQDAVGGGKNFLDYLEILICNLFGYDDEDGCDESDSDNEESSNLAEDDYDFDDEDVDVGCFDARRRVEDGMPVFIYRRY